MISGHTSYWDKQKTMRSNLQDHEIQIVPVTHICPTEAHGAFVSVQRIEPAIARGPKDCTWSLRLRGG